MKTTDLIKGLLFSLYASLKRFPIAIGYSIAATILMIVFSHNEQRFNGNIQELIGRITMILALGIPISLCTQLIFERKERVPLIVKAATYLLEALGLVFYFFFLLRNFSMVSVTRYIGVTLAFYLACTYISYFFRRSGVELYVIKLFTRFFTTVIYSIVLFLGLVAILFTIDTLLEIKIAENLYFEVWLCVVGIFASCFFLAGVPLYQEKFEASFYPKLLKVLVLYIVMPIISIYTVILYVYFAKIIMTLQWPIGMVAHLVLWYSVICAGVIFLISPLYDESKWAKTFTFILPKVIIPLIIMMFIAIGIRVSEYGITENRYYVLLLGLWAFGVMIYLNFNKGRRNIILLVSLSLIALLSVAGPWSSYSVSKFSQNQRLEGILLKYDMIKDRAVMKSGNEVSAEDQKEISQILSYFSEAHTLNDIKILPKEFKISQMDDVFGFAYTENDFETDNNRNEYFSYSSDMINGVTDIGGYSHMFSVNNYDSPIKSDTYGMEIKYDSITHEIRIYSGSKEIYKGSLQNLAKQVYPKYGVGDKYDIDPKEMSFADENDNIKVKFIFTYIDGYEDKIDHSVDINTMDFFILISLK